ncbi:hypothetical protein VTK73DRAFT_7055 [Phialemonium thermophilum]|uniref:Uncharacterized protein n=1 Tax=Phialemonium thermophilum TaxID=223376 RepID=A0ABR3WGY6_9PEZI
MYKILMAVEDTICFHTCYTAPVRSRLFRLFQGRGVVQTFHVVQGLIFGRSGLLGARGNRGRVAKKKGTDTPSLPLWTPQDIQAPTCSAELLVPSCTFSGAVWHAEHDMPRWDQCNPPPSLLHVQSPAIPVPVQSKAQPARNYSVKWKTREDPFRRGHARPRPRPPRSPDARFVMNAFGRDGLTFQPSRDRSLDLIRLQHCSANTSHSFDIIVKYTRYKSTLTFCFAHSDTPSSFPADASVSCDCMPR